MELYTESTRVFFKIFLINFKLKIKLDNESLIIKKYNQFYSYNFISFSNFVYNLFCINEAKKKLIKKIFVFEKRISNSLIKTSESYKKISKQAGES